MSPVTESLWIILGCVALACATGFGACALASRPPKAPGRGSAPSRRSPVLPRPGYLILEPETGHVPWQAATAPEPWPAVPEHLHSDQMAQLAALEREITQMEAEARKLAGRYLP